MTRRTLPPLEPQVQYMIFEVVSEGDNNTLITAPISPNPGTDKEKQRDAMEMLAATTGKDYVIMESHVIQQWGAASFDYVTETLKVN